MQQPELWLGGVRQNLPEFSWLVSRAIVTDHYAFQCSKAMSFGYCFVRKNGVGLAPKKIIKLMHSGTSESAPFKRDEVYLDHLSLSRKGR